MTAIVEAANLDVVPTDATRLLKWIADVRSVL
jgi:hypothetical protein